MSRMDDDVAFLHRSTNFYNLGHTMIYRPDAAVRARAEREMQRLYVDRKESPENGTTTTEGSNHASPQPTETLWKTRPSS